MSFDAKKLGIPGKVFLWTIGIVILLVLFAFALSGTTLNDSGLYLPELIGFAIGIAILIYIPVKIYFVIRIKSEEGKINLESQWVFPIIVIISILIGLWFSWGITAWYYFAYINYVTLIFITIISFGILLILLHTLKTNVLYQKQKKSKKIKRR